MSNYESMSDGEITWRVHHAYNKVPKGYATICVADYCNNPSDAWPIIVENKIALDFIDGFGWTASPAYNPSLEVSCHDAPLRAAMICFLKMKDAEHEKDSAN